MPAKRSQPRKIRFTKPNLLALDPPEKSRIYLYDEKTPSLAICVTATGHKAFYFYRKVSGIPKRLKLGNFPEVTIEQARKLAIKAAGEIADGKDPHASRQLKRGEMTLGDLFDWFMEYHAKIHKASWKEDEANFRRYLSHWRNRKLSSIERTDVITLHDKVGKKGKIAANRTLALLKTIFSKAEDDHPNWSGPSPAARVKKFPEKPRERYLHPDEMEAFFKALNEEQHDGFKLGFMIAILTGIRRSNIFGMRWEQLHLKRRTWEIPKTKNSESQTVALVDHVVDLLLAHQKGAGDSPWVFPSFGKTGHLVEPKGAWKRIVARSGLSNLRIHDLRRTLGSWQASAGFSDLIIGKTLGQKSPEATRIYARLNLAPVRAALETVTDAILKAGKVVETVDDEHSQNGENDDE